MADTAVETIREIMEENGWTPTTAKTVVPALEDLGDAIAAGGGGGGGGGGASIDLGITGASVGDVPQVAETDPDGKPTEWTSLTLTAPLTISCVTQDGTKVTGQTVTVANTDTSTSTTYPYEGAPITAYLPIGAGYQVSVSDAMPMQGSPSTATGTIASGGTSVTLTYGTLDSVLEKDSQTGRYTNASLASWWSRQRDGKVFGVATPKTTVTDIHKTDDNADLPNPTPGWVGVPAIDAYDGKLGPYLRVDVNGGADPDGTPFVTAIRGIDSSFRLDGTNGDVWSMTPVYYRQEIEDADSVTMRISDTAHTGFEVCPNAKMPDGTLRPYMLRAKYPGVKGSDDKMHSYSGKPIWNRTVSHNSTITQCDTANTGYSGKTAGDDLYLKDMFLTKYSGKNSQSVFTGCASYNLNYDVTVAEEGVKRVIIATSNAKNLVVGSWVTIGTANNGTQVLTETQITSIEAYDSSNSIVNLAAASSFDTAVGNKLSTAPWGTGRCDGVVGDGAYSKEALTNSKEPFVIQGIEVMHGATEILGNVIISNDGESGWVPYVNFDTRNEATSLTADYESTEAVMYSDGNAGWKYPLYPRTTLGLQFGRGTGASTTTGMCDGHYMNKSTDTGTREWLSLGDLNGGAFDGLWCVFASYELTGTYWVIASRLSANGRSHA